MPTVSWGLLDLEDTEPTADAAVGDPVLTKLGEAIRAVLNGRGKAKWQAVHKTSKPGTEPLPVMNVFYHNPNEVVFNTDKAPCLYLFRANMPQTKWVAADELISEDTVTVIWLYPNKPQAKEAPQHPFVNLVTKSLSQFFWRGCDPNWVDADDSDSLAASRGSLLLTRCNLWGIEQGKSTVKPVKIEYLDTRAKEEYRALEIELIVRERASRDLSDLAESAVTATIETTDDDPLVNVEFTA